MFNRLAPWIVGLLLAVNIVAYIVNPSPFIVACMVIAGIALGSTIATAILTRNRQ